MTIPTRATRAEQCERVPRRLQASLVPKGVMRMQSRMGRIGGRIWTDTAPIKGRRARPYLSELGCHTVAPCGELLRHPNCAPQVGLAQKGQRRSDGGREGCVGAGTPRYLRSTMRSGLLAQAEE